MQTLIRATILWSALTASLLAAETDLRGRLSENVACVADASQTYALYVPTSYTNEKIWPVIYCFDPGARGKTPVERLQAAAEKYGYIIAGSNNSRNGSWEVSEAALRAMTQDVAARFSIDRRRVYAAGMSGGARVAIQVAVVGYAKGVIACSAGFPAMEQGMPLRVPFPIFGTAGVEDFNYAEMRQLEAGLEERKAEHRLVIFEGTHEWASAALLTQGVEWFELHAMRGGMKTRDKALIADLWQRRLSAVPAQVGLERWKELKSLAADFKGLRDTSAVELEVKDLGASSIVKTQLKQERARTAREFDLGGKLADAADEKPSSRQKRIAELLGMMNAPADSPDRQMARRLVAGFFSRVREDVRARFASEEYGSAAGMLEIAGGLRPNQSWTWFDLARARAFRREFPPALEALGKAATAGLSDAGKVETEPAFAKLKDDPAFQAILTKIRLNPPEPERRAGEGRGFSP